MAVNTPAELASVHEDPMHQAFSAGRSSSTKPVGTRDSSRGSRTFYSRLIGALFLLGFLSHGEGFAL